MYSHILRKLFSFTKTDGLYLHQMVGQVYPINLNEGEYVVNIEMEISNKLSWGNLLNPFRLNLYLSQKDQFRWDGKPSSFVKEYKQWEQHIFKKRLDLIPGRYHSSENFLSSLGREIEKLYLNRKLYLTVRRKNLGYVCNHFGHPGGSCWYGYRIEKFKRFGGYAFIVSLEDSPRPKAGIGRCWAYQKGKEIVIFHGYYKGEGNSSQLEKLVRRGLNCHTNRYNVPRRVMNLVSYDIGSAWICSKSGSVLGLNS